MPVSFSGLNLGECYDRPTLSKLWGYKDWHAIGRGVVTPAGESVIVLFITKEKQEALEQYEDHFEGDRLRIEGETSHAADRRIVNARGAGDTIHLFHRDKHHSCFVYYGEIELDDHELRTDQPSRFVFRTNRSAVLATAREATNLRFSRRPAC